MDPREMRIEDFDYVLPEERIALHPLTERDASRLLVCRAGSFREDTFRNLAEHLPEGSLTVFNDTRVIEARLFFETEGGGLTEAFLLQPVGHGGDLSAALSKNGSSEWHCLVKGASKWKVGRSRSISTGPFTLQATMLGRVDERFLMRLEWEPKESILAEVLHRCGSIPLPPYIRRPVEEADAGRYQTVYASRHGSVAAPTAGLHFTDAVMRSLDAKNTTRIRVTLHVGAGTFRPVKSEQMGGHEMHGEYMEVGLEEIRLMRDFRGPRFAVGTTSLRTMESLYWMGCRVLQSPDVCAEEMGTSQWEPYGPATAVEVPRKEALDALCDWVARRGGERLLAQTRLIVAPGYRFRMIDGLVTNFHQPRSTLLLLVAAVLGERWREAYTYALDRGFRFLSYGDSCLMFVEKDDPRS